MAVAIQATSSRSTWIKVALRRQMRLQRDNRLMRNTPKIISVKYNDRQLWVGNRRSPESREGHKEYKAASQNFTANGRYVESRQNHGSQKWLLVARSGRTVAAQRMPLPGRFQSLALVGAGLHYRHISTFASISTGMHLVTLCYSRAINLR